MVSRHRRLARAWLWWEDHGWALANAILACAILAGLALLLAGCGRGVSTTGPSDPEPMTGPAPSASGGLISTRAYWPLDVGTVWPLVREDAPALRTTFTVTEDENGCKALTITKNDAATYHVRGRLNTTVFHVQERADALYANNCLGGFTRDGHPDEERFDPATGRRWLAAWYIGERPYYLMPWVVRDGDEVHGQQSYVIETDGHTDETAGMWSVRYSLLPGNRLRVAFTEDAFGIAEDWTFEYGEGLVMIESWNSTARTGLKFRLVRG